MLKIVTRPGQLSFSGLMDVYRETNLKASGGDRGEKLLQAEQDFYSYLSQVFFRTPGAVYAIWEEDGVYASALRLEPYRDGLLISALETAPNKRRKGFAAALIRAVQQRYSGTGLYSHIALDNVASRNLHRRLGFQKHSHRSTYLDGSTDTRCETYFYLD